MQESGEVAKMVYRSPEKATFKILMVAVDFSIQWRTYLQAYTYVCVCSYLRPFFRYFISKRIRHSCPNLYLKAHLTRLLLRRQFSISRLPYSRFLNWNPSAFCVMYSNHFRLPFRFLETVEGPRETLRLLDCIILILKATRFNIVLVQKRDPAFIRPDPRSV